MPLDLIRGTHSEPPADAIVRDPRQPRFYQHLCPPFPNEPRRDRLSVVETADGKGEGVQALVAFAPGEIVFTFTGTVLGEQTLFTLQIEPGRYISDPLMMGKVLHSCDPNMDCDMATLTFRARRYIAPGEMLSMDYETTEDELFRSFHCGCGSANCRGLIRGRRFQGLVYSRVG